MGRLLEVYNYPGVSHIFTKGPVTIKFNRIGELTDRDNPTPLLEGDIPDAATFRAARSSTLEEAAHAYFENRQPRWKTIINPLI